MQLSDFGITRKSTLLSDGIPLVVFEGPGAMPVSLRVAFLSGSQFDPARKEGLAHFTEHMICSGTSELPGKTDIGRFVEQRGAYFNAGTGLNTMTVITDWGDPADTPQLVHFMGSLLTDSLFSPESIEQERGAILAEMGGKLADPSTYVHRLWRQVAYADTPLGRDTIGDEESVKSITRKDLLTYYQQMYGSGRAAIVASGGTTLQQMKELIEAQPFMHSARPLESFELLPAAEYKTTIKHYPNSPQVYLNLGIVCPEEDHPEEWALSLLLRIVGRGRVSVVHQRL
jgi:predicted Zn-dependent peptidase